MNRVINHIAPEPVPNSWPEKTQVSTTVDAQSARGVNILSSVAASVPATLSAAYKSNYPGSRFVPADIYDHPMTVGIDPTNPDLVGNPLPGIYDAANQQLAYWRSNKEDMMVASTKGTTIFYGTQAGHDCTVIVGDRTHVVWASGLKDSEAETCSGKWGAIVCHEKSA
jgi:hypothetical protein